MADSSIAATPGVGANVDTRTQAGGDHRQVVVIGDADAAATALIDAIGVAIRPGKATAAALANVTASTSSVTLAAANTARAGLHVFNDSTSVLFLKYGSGAASSSFTVKLLAGAFWEMPPGLVYTGLVAGIWVSADGAARVTELS